MNRIGAYLLLIFIVAIGIQAQTPQKKSDKSKKTNQFEPPPEMPKGVIVGPGGIVGPPPPAAPKYPIEAWKEASFAQDKFSIAFPIKPEEQSKTDSVNGVATTSTIYEVLTMDGTYSVTVIKLPFKKPETEEELKQRLRGMLKQLEKGSYKWLGGKEIMVNGYPGIEFKYQSQGPGLISWQKFVAADIYMYRIIAETIPRKPELQEPPVFLNSFKLLPREQARINDEIPPPPPPAAGPTGKGIFQPATPPPPPAPISSYPLEAWKVMPYPQAGFAASFPTKPTEKSKSATRNGTERVSTEYKVVAKDGTYSVTLTQLIGQGGATKEQIQPRLAGMLKGLEEGPYKWLGGKEIEIEGYPGIEFKYQYLQFEEISWQRMLFVDDRIYTVIVDSPVNKPNLKEPKLFMDSFKLLAIESAGANPPPPPPAPGQSFGGGTKPLMMRVSGGVLNDNALKKVHPRYPQEAMATRATGAVQVAITVSEEGKVIEANAVSGHELLRAAAVEAAQQWTFKPTEVSGVPVKLQGILTFNFTLQ